MLLAQAAARKGEKRTAAANDQGHQKTPSMIKAVLEDALAGRDDGCTAPRGGFTDVGLHTGGLPRNTSWPLVVAVLQELLEDAQHEAFFRMAMAQMKLWLAELITAMSKSPTAKRGVVRATTVNNCMQVLTAAVREGAGLADEQTHVRDGERRRHEIGAFEARCVLVRAQLEETARLHAETLASEFHLPALSKSELPCSNPALSPPEETRPTRGPEGLGVARKKAESNLGWLPAPPKPTDHTTAGLLFWMAQPKLQKGLGAASALLVLETVESVVFAKMSGMMQKGWTSNCLTDEGASQMTVKSLEQIVDQYRHVASSFRSSKEAAALLTVNRKSRELLVVWCAYCLVHRMTLPFEFKVLGEYGVALRPEDLRHLVLSDKLAIEAAQNVTAYLRTHTKPDLEVFSLRPKDVTFSMATLHSRRSPSTQSLWESEKAAAASRQAAHWKVVQEKQAKLRVLDQELDLLKGKLTTAETNRACYRYPTSHGPPRGTSSDNDQEYRKYDAECDNLNTQISRTNGEIQKTEVPPPPIFQPLPAQEAAAQPILFFLTMPIHFQVLSRLSFAAQQQLLPSSGTVVHSMSEEKIDVQGAIAQESAKTIWRDYYLNTSTARHLSSAIDTKVHLQSDHTVPQSSHFSPRSVRTFSSPSTGIWHPDELRPRLLWTGGGCDLDQRGGAFFNNKKIGGGCDLDQRGGAFFNPFVSLPDAALVLTFTEKLTDSAHRVMQWAMEQHGATSLASRGNVAEARQDIKPGWLAGKPELFCFGAMRAYPNQQIRKVCIALRERSIPLDNPAVRRLLQSSLYHLGELSGGTNPRPVWRTDLECHGGWEALRLELTDLADELQNKPRQHSAVLILGEIAAHASQWDAETREVARSFGAIALTWAREEIESANSSKVPQLRARRCIFSMYAIICHGAGELSPADVSALCEAVLLADYSRLFEDPSPLDAVVQELTVVSHEVLARRLPELLRALDADATPLTEAVRVVLEALTPASLDWKRVEYTVDLKNVPTVCYEAVSQGSEPHLFSVNIQTGVILFDGLPPSRLPKTILDLPLYRRTFLDRNFEVVLTSSGVLETVRFQSGFKYEFFVNAQGNLVAREIDPRNEDAPLELLDGTLQGVGAWGGELPIRLQQMHSHWLCRSMDTMVLRPVRFDQRSVQFIVMQSTVLLRLWHEGLHLHNFAGNPGWLCFRVMDHQADLSWLTSTAQVDTFDQLVIPADSKVLHVLGKFETQPGLVHAFYAADGAMIFELPRYDLAFELKGEGAQRLTSKNFRGFSLAAKQQLHDAMYDFTEYLILDSARETLLIMPAGHVTRDGFVHIDGPSACHHDRRLHAFDLHPRFLTFEARVGATAIEARLQLAAVHAATGTELPETRSQHTGGELALELLRQSWNGGPMNDREQHQLDSISTFSQLTPALPLLCYEIDTCARELLCLRPDVQVSEPEPCNFDAATEYTLRKQRAQLSSRALLTAEEEARVLSSRVRVRPNGASALSAAGNLVVAACPSAAREITGIEQTLDAMLVSEPADPSEAKGFPLAESDVEETALGRKILGELQESWSAHQRMPSVQLAREPAQLYQELLVQKGLAHAVSERVERHLLLWIGRIPPCASWHAPAFVMRRAANLEPRITRRDLARAAWAPETLRQFNPFLTEVAMKELRLAILEWLSLCVLEDKLDRMALLAADANTQELERELREVGREWSVKQHPQWLVFEVEQRLQIRRVQYHITQFCIDNPGAITQLNMGEGKTRIILPMLVLHLSQPERLVRLHFLSQLIDEAYYYLHRHLTASLMCRRLLRLPFHRDVKLTVQHVAMMHDCLTRCMRASGVVCVAPEHRLSLQLKWHEMRLASGKTDLIKQLPLLDSLPYCDLLDESDELLHHKYQLIYAHGSNVMLPAGKQRWQSVQTLLGLLQTSPQVASILKQPNVARRLAVRDERGAGAFDDLRLLAGEALDSTREPLNQALASNLLADPPYHMRWLKGHALRIAIFKFVTNPKMSVEWLAEQDAAGDINQLQLDQLLATRGLLATGLLEHCLSRRHRVDYGVDARRGATRRVAVPYRASDTPSERAEYAQPDTLILLTHLSYYHSGVSRADLKEAVTVLLTLGQYAQKAEYALWLDSARTTMSATQLNKLDNVNKLDVTSDVTLDLLHEVYRYNMAAMNYWLDACVLPRETMQFPNRLVANPFNLTDNPTGAVIGFSGTKDNHLLLPLHVSQRTPDGADELLATDGKMCNLVLQNEEVVCLEEELIPSEAVIKLAIERSAAALIDAGATMAGLSNLEVARRVITKLPERSPLEGVVYFDKMEASWYVLNRRGRMWPQSSSPIHEKDAFVYFDESRCRGADMKLLPNAMAILTVGPDMCKEKLMQAAGRMRKLDRGQKLLFAVPPELAPKIRASLPLAPLDLTEPTQPVHFIAMDEDRNGLTSLDLLKWLMKNTTRALAAGTLEYSSQASHFCMTQDPKARLLDESLGLKELYGGAIGEDHVDAVVQRVLERDRARCGKLGIEYNATALRLSDEVQSRANMYGADLTIFATGIEEECERELENERELEREREMQIPKQAPRTPVKWNFKAVRTADSPMKLKDAGVTNLSDAVPRYLDASLSAIPWEMCRIFVTGAFMETVTDSQGGPLNDLSQFMRPPDAVIVFPSSEVLLLAEWEADHLLALLWEYSSTGKHPFMVNLAYLREAADKMWAVSHIRMRVPASRPRSDITVNDLTVAGLQLLAGETMFATDARKESVRVLTTPTMAAKKAALQLVSLRGRQHMISRSDLELICNIDIGEA